MCNIGMQYQGYVNDTKQYFLMRIIGRNIDICHRKSSISEDAYQNREVSFKQFIYNP
jgi:hypothetical protein